MPTVEQRLKRFEATKKRRINWEETYRDALEFTAQRRDTFDDKETGEKQYTQVFDSTAISAITKFASNLQSGLVPPFKKWIKLTPGANIPEENKSEAEKTLEAITNTMFKYIHTSNFDTQVSESFIDLAMGTGALLVNEGDDSQPLHFIAVPLSELYLEDGKFGQIQTVFRLFKMSVRNIKAQWPKANLPDDLSQLGKEDTEVEVV